MAEIYRRWSPYSYCTDNPLSYIDPDGMEVKNANDEEVKRREEEKKKADENNQKVNDGKTKNQLKSEGKWKGKENRDHRKAMRGANRAASNLQTALNNQAGANQDITYLKDNQRELFDALNSLPFDVYIGRTDNEAIMKTGGAGNEWFVNPDLDIVTCTSTFNKADARCGVTIWTSSTNHRQLRHEAGHVVSYGGKDVPSLGIPGIRYGTENMPKNMVDLFVNYRFMLTGNDEEFRTPTGTKLANDTVRAAIIAESLKDSK